MGSRAREPLPYWGWRGYGIVTESEVSSFWAGSYADPGWAYDPVRGKVVLFGGDKGDGVFGGTWTYDANGWTALSPTNCTSSDAPSPRISSSMEWDGEKIVLYGGQDSPEGTTFYDDTWYLAPDGEGDLCWTQDTALPTDPGFRSKHRMAYSPTRDEILLFGGTLRATSFGPDAFDNQTWFYKRGQGWKICPFTDHACGALPAARCCMGLAAEDTHGRTILFGGGSGVLGQYNDTWTYGGTTGWVCKSSVLVCNAPG